MKRIAWLTDIHLNFAEDPSAEDYLTQVAASGAEVVLIGGDISESQNLLEYLQMIDDHLQRPVYFVLGNHDFYHGSITTVRERVREFCHQHPRLRYLTQEQSVELTPQVGLVGEDGWADAQYGNYLGSYVMMSDYKLIAELAPYHKETRWPVLRAMGDEAADRVREKLPAALNKSTHVVLLTHVPPLLGACWHEGKISDDEWSPHFTCKAVGDAIMEIASQFPDRKLTVLCGHTHGEGEIHPLPNVTILTGGAEYGHPAITRIFEIE